MIGRGLFLVTMLSTCVLSLPVTSRQLENEDVKVMKCIVEALADVLTMPHPTSVSQECLVTLRTDDRLVTILRHRNFLKELQEIAVHGSQERARPPQATDAASDRSMLEALGGPGERSLLTQNKRKGHGDGEGEKGESQREDDLIEEVRREDEKSPGSHEWSEGKADEREDKEEGEDEGSEEKRVDSEEENLSKSDEGATSEEKRNAPRNKSKDKIMDKDEEEEEQEKDKRSSLSSHKRVEEEEEEEDEEGMKRWSGESLQPWPKRNKGLHLKKKKNKVVSQQEMPHHSKEVAGSKEQQQQQQQQQEEEEEEKKKRGKKRSPEETELQMIARRAPEEEEGSAGRKSEEPEIESLAAIESELENIAQKLHELRQG